MDRVRTAAAGAIGAVAFYDAASIPVGPLHCEPQPAPAHRPRGILIGAGHNIYLDIRGLRIVFVPGPSEIEKIDDPGRGKEQHDTGAGQQGTCEICLPLIDGECCRTKNQKDRRYHAEWPPLIHCGSRH